MEGSGLMKTLYSGCLSFLAVKYSQGFFFFFLKEERKGEKKGEKKWEHKKEGI